MEYWIYKDDCYVFIIGFLLIVVLSKLSLERNEKAVFFRIQLGSFHIERVTARLLRLQYGRYDFTSNLKSTSK